MPTANETFSSRKPGGNATLADELARQQAQLAAMTVAQRADKFGYSSFSDGEFVMAYDALGQARMRIGTQSDGSFGVIYANGDPPPKPSPPRLAARQLAIGVYWDGLFDNGKARPGDVVRVDIHMSTNVGFTPDPTTACGSLTAEGVELLTADNITHYVKLVAVTSSDVISTPSDEVAVLPLAASSIAAKAIGAEQLAANIALLSRLIVGQPTAGRIEIDGREGAVQGLRMYSPGGEETVTFDAGTGTATMRGELRTNDTGARIVIPRPTSNGISTIRFYPTSGDNYAMIAAAPDVRGAFEAYSGYSDDDAYSTLSMYSVGTSLAFRDQIGPLGALTVTGTAAYMSYAEINGIQTNNYGVSTICVGTIVMGLLPSATATTATRYLRVATGGTVPTDVLFESSALQISWLFTQQMGTDANSAGILALQSTSATPVSVGGASFIQYTSEVAHKEEISPVPFNSVEVVRAAPSQEWQYRPENTVSETPARRVGPMVDDLPATLVVEGPDGIGKGISVTDQVGVLWDAVGQLANGRDLSVSAAAAVAAELVALTKVVTALAQRVDHLDHQGDS